MNPFLHSLWLQLTSLPRMGDLRKNRMLTTVMVSIRHAFVKAWIPHSPAEKACRRAWEQWEIITLEKGERYALPSSFLLSQGSLRWVGHSPSLERCQQLEVVMAVVSSNGFDMRLSLSLMQQFSDLLLPWHPSCTAPCCNGTILHKISWK